MNPWPFPDPPNLAVIVNRKIFQDGDRIEYVSHDADDTGQKVSSQWQGWETAPVHLPGPVHHQLVRIEGRRFAEAGGRLLGSRS